MKTHRLLLLASLTIVLLTGCRHVRDVAYFQEANTSNRDSSGVRYPNFNKNNTPKIQNYEARIQPNDILSIYVSSLSKEASAFFNNVETHTEGGSSFSTQTEVGYLVDVSGFIEMPLVGKVKLAGLTTQVARDTLTRRLENFLQGPSVRIYFENFRVTLLGEVGRPGVYNVTNEKLTIPEAIGLAGDLTIYGNRKNIMLIREIDGEKIFFKIDLSSRDLFNSPYYYLHSNDVLYVEPVTAKVSSSDNFYKITPLIMSMITLVVVVLIRLQIK